MSKRQRQRRPVTNAKVNLYSAEERRVLDKIYRPLWYKSYNGDHNLLKVGDRTFPFTIKGQRAASLHANKTGLQIEPFRNTGKKRKKEKEENE